MLGRQDYPCPFHRYTVYQNRMHVFLVGHDKIRNDYSILKISRADAVDTLVMREGETRYSEKEFAERFAVIQKSEGFQKVVEGSGIIGFPRFLQGYYIFIITKHKKVGRVLEHHPVYSIEKTALVALYDSGDSALQDTRKEEIRFRELLNVLNLTKDFYFSHSYDLSKCLQYNYMAASCRAQGIPVPDPKEYMGEWGAAQEFRYVWNYHLMARFLEAPAWAHWCLPIVHGFFAHARCSCFGRAFEIVLIARRSRLFAGTRYRKRGVNAEGNVANDVETEQILFDSCTSQAAMAFVQNRSSVPVFWTQEASAMVPKPPILYHKVDPNFTATRNHFSDLFARYGAPILVVNLMKHGRNLNDETELGKKFEAAVNVLNQELPLDARILYKAYDLKNAHRSKSDSVYQALSWLAESIVTRVGFFYVTKPNTRPLRVQTGVMRTNCVDCLDRTNVAQFFVGRCVLAHQLAALAFLPEPKLDFDSQVVSVLSELYDLMGDHLSLQYGGSIAHKKYTRERPRMMKQSKELLTSLKRHYTNSFADSEKQQAMNVFLGVLDPRRDPRPWMVDTDAWLHHDSLDDEYSPGYWWMGPLAFYVDQLLILKLLDPPRKVVYQLTSSIPADNPPVVKLVRPEIADVVWNDESDQGDDESEGEDAESEGEEEQRSQEGEGEDAPVAESKEGEGEGAAEGSPPPQEPQEPPCSLFDSYYKPHKLTSFDKKANLGSSVCIHVHINSSIRRVKLTASRALLNCTPPSKDCPTAAQLCAALVWKEKIGKGEETCYVDRAGKLLPTGTALIAAPDSSIRLPVPPQVATEDLHKYRQYVDGEALFRRGDSTGALTDVRRRQISDFLRRGESHFKLIYYTYRKEPQHAPPRLPFPVPPHLKVRRTRPITRRRESGLNRSSTPSSIASLPRGGPGQTESPLQRSSIDGDYTDDTDTELETDQEGGGQDEEQDVMDYLSYLLQRYHHQQFIPAPRTDRDRGPASGYSSATSKGGRHHKFRTGPPGVTQQASAGSATPGVLPMAWSSRSTGGRRLTLPGFNRNKVPPINTSDMNGGTWSTPWAKMRLEDSAAGPLSVRGVDSSREPRKTVSHSAATGLMRWADVNSLSNLPAFEMNDAAGAGSDSNNRLLWRDDSALQIMRSRTSSHQHGGAGGLDLLWSGKGQSAEGHREMYGHNGGMSGGRQGGGEGERKGGGASTRDDSVPHSASSLTTQQWTDLSRLMQQPHPSQLHFHKRPFAPSLSASNFAPGASTSAAPPPPAPTLQPPTPGESPSSAPVSPFLSARIPSSVPSSATTPKEMSDEKEPGAHRGRDRGGSSANKDSKESPSISHAIFSSLRRFHPPLPPTPSNNRVHQTTSNTTTDSAVSSGRGGFLGGRITPRDRKGSMSFHEGVPVPSSTGHGHHKNKSVSVAVSTAHTAAPSRKNSYVELFNPQPGSSSRLPPLDTWSIQGGASGSSRPPSVGPAVGGHRGYGVREMFWYMNSDDPRPPPASLQAAYGWSVLAEGEEDPELSLLNQAPPPPVPAAARPAAPQTVPHTVGAGVM
ncbi:unnamed protein product [Vitrella brassicaformis CCMP3155]|uniref:SAC domain-containing protein n=2 Tax=Vitrella brassicaformis TaxID=1169539 RepID=A0A0G4GVQ1_VITBC|nr:unnamed protein product [Vitrella brassicaformis CCMP3155]|eukprot:CEM34996.1 unnamed protein product [Vitrella brassicaformis CCMP3155]